MSTSSAEILNASATGTVATKFGKVDRPQRVLWLHAKVTTSATAGNRQIRFTLYNAAGTNILDIRAGATQAASLVRHYVFALGAVREGSFTGGNEIMLPLPGVVITPNMYFMVEDENAVDAADVVAVTYQAEL